MPFNSPRHRTFRCLSHFNNSSFSACWKWREKIFFPSASVEVSDVLKLSGKVFVCSEGFHWLQWFLRIIINSLYPSYICSNWKSDLMSEAWKHRPRRCLGGTGSVYVCVLYTWCGIRVLCSVFQCWLEIADYLLFLNKTASTNPVQISFLMRAC